MARDTYESARDAVRPYVGDLPAMPARSSERVYRQALIALHVDISDLALDNTDSGTAFRDRFMEWRAIRDKVAMDDEAREGAKAIQEFEDAFAEYRRLFGENFPFEADGETPLASDIYRDMLGRLRVQIPDDLDPDQYAGVYRAWKSVNGPGGRPINSGMAGDSAAFASRHPYATTGRRLF